MPKSLTQVARELEEQLEAVRVAPPNPPDLDALWASVKAVQTALAAHAADKHAHK